MVLIVFFSSRISPFTSTVILRERSPFATAVVTSAMFLTWPVRFEAMKFTLSVRSFHVPATPGTFAWPPRRPSVPTSRATRVTSPANTLKLSTIVLMVCLSSRISPFTSAVIFLERSPFATAVVTSAMFLIWPVRLEAIAFTLSVRSFHVPPTPGPAAWPTRRPRSFRWKGAELSGHRVDGVLQLRGLSLRFDRDLLGEVSLGNRRSDIGDIANLAGEIRGHEIHVVRQVLPRAGDARYFRLTAEHSLGSYFARNARHFRGERAQLIHHDVYGALELEDFSHCLCGDLSREISLRNCSSHVSDVSDLSGEARRHRVHVVGQVLPRAAYSGDSSLTTQASFRSYLARDTSHFRCKSAELIDHRVDGVLQLRCFSFRFDSDLLGEVSLGAPGRPRRYISDLAGEVTRQRVHVVGEVLPRSADARYFRLTAEHSLGAHLARHARHFRGERAQLVHHRVDGVLQLENLTFHVHRDLPRQIALRHSGSNVSNVSDLAGEVGRHRVHVVREILPRAADSGYLRLTTELSFGSHFLGDTGYFRSKPAQLIDHRVDGVLELERFTPGFDGDLLTNLLWRLRWSRPQCFSPGR